MRESLSKLADMQKVRFLVVGALNTALGFGLYGLFYWLMGGASSYLAAFILSYCLSVVVSFAFYRLWVFPVKGNLFLDAFRYLLVSLFSTFSVNIILLPLAVEIFGWNPLISQAIILVMIVFFNYFAHRYFSFHRKASSGTKR